jgi:hypothetical protein
MSRAKPVAAETVTQLAKDLGTLKPKRSISIREAIYEVGPQIDKAVEMGYLRTEIQARIAKQFHCTADLVARYDSQRRKKRRR